MHSIPGRLYCRTFVDIREPGGEFLKISNETPDSPGTMRYVCSSPPKRYCGGNTGTLVPIQPHPNPPDVSAVLLFPLALLLFITLLPRLLSRGLICSFHWLLCLIRLGLEEFILPVTVVAGPFREVPTRLTSAIRPILGQRVALSPLRRRPSEIPDCLRLLTVFQSPSSFGGLCHLCSDCSLG